MLGGGRVRLHSSVCGNASVPASPVEETPHSLDGLDTSVKNLSTVHARVYFWPLSSGPLVCTPLCGGATLDYCFVVVSSELGNVSIQFVLLF